MYIVRTLSNNNKVCLPSGSVCLSFSLIEPNAIPASDFPIFIINAWLCVHNGEHGERVLRPG